MTYVFAYVKTESVVGSTNTIIEYYINRKTSSCYLARTDFLADVDED